MTALTKNLQPPTKKIFFSSADEKTCRIFCGIEQLSSAIGGGAMALVRQPKTAGFRPISKYEYIVPRLSRCWTAEATVVAKIFSFRAERLMELES